MYGLQNTYVSGGWGEGGGSSLAWTEDDERTVSFEKKMKKRFINEMKMSYTMFKVL